ncbi:MAG: hypothetical protein ABIM59_04910, partial [candidate division WOR-3 bacterium]
MQLEVGSAFVLHGKRYIVEAIEKYDAVAVSYVDSTLTLQSLQGITNNIFQKIDIGNFSAGDLVRTRYERAI